MENYRVLITSLGTATATAAIKSLKKYAPDFCGFIVGTDINEKCRLAGAVFCDVFEQVPRYDNPAYIEVMRDVCERHAIQYILPVHDYEVEVLAKNRKQFSPAIICASDEKTITTCNDKLLTGKKLAENGIECPSAWELTPENLSLNQLPLFVKPRWGVGSTDCFQVKYADEWPFVLRHVRDPIAQPVLDGNQYVLDVLNDRRGKNLVVIPRREYVSKAGVGTNVRIERDAQLESFGVRVAETLGICGPANIEVFVKGDRISLIEVNPRLSAGHIFSVLAGVNLPLLTIRIFSGESVAPECLKWRSGMNMNRYWEEEIYYDTEK